MWDEARPARAARTGPSRPTLSLRVGRGGLLRSETATFNGGDASRAGAPLSEDGYEAAELRLPGIEWVPRDESRVHGGRPGTCARSHLRRHPPREMTRTQ